ncbi:MAG TPA: AraC family transcriptional regulator [Burkholderiaceae bacterium]|nr:AraC family transcriptional regulator [Burkholderiaceae bacterium]
MDALSEILSGIRLSGTAFIDAELSAPWSVQTPSAAAIARRLAPRAARIIPYHFIAEGTCSVRVLDRTLGVAAQEVICFPHGDVHQIASSADVRPEPVTAEALIGLTRAEEVSRVQYGGGGITTRIVCGFFAFESELSDRIVAPLPSVLKFRVGADSAALLLPGAVRESRLRAAHDAKPGTHAVLCKLSELLFVEAVRSYVETLEDPAAGWFAALKDRHVSAALALMHGRPERPWTLERLAASIGASRSTLADRFVRILGQAPMQYLSQWRLQLAADALAFSHRATKSIASDAGFGSPAAFSRAFKREFGASPARWRARTRRPRVQESGGGAGLR